MRLLRNSSLLLLGYGCLVYRLHWPRDLLLSYGYLIPGLSGCYGLRLLLC
jgi:hypothetical protein